MTLREGLDTQGQQELADGILSDTGIAKALNERGVKKRRGGSWSATQGQWLMAT